MDVGYLPKSPKEAKKVSSRFYFTGRPCKRGHVSKRQTSDAACVECKREQGRDNVDYHKAYYRTHRAEVIARSGARSARLALENPEFNAERYAATRGTQRQYRETHRETRNAQTRSSYSRNRADRLAYAVGYRCRTVEQRRAYAASRYLKMRDYYFAQAALRRAAKDQRTPKWLTDEQRASILKMYSERAGVTKMTGILHHVDHIIPLRGKSVSGLHVPWNLQVIPASENLSKNNKFTAGYQ